MAVNERLEKTLIKKTPGVCGGDACIGNRRMPVWVLVSYRRLGASDETIKTSFDPTLTASELEAAWEYYEGHRAEIDEAILDNESGDDEVE